MFSANLPTNKIVSSVVTHGVNTCPPENCSLRNDIATIRNSREVVVSHQEINIPIVNSNGSVMTSIKQDEGLICENKKISDREKEIYKDRTNLYESCYLYGGLVNSLYRRNRRWSLGGESESIKKNEMVINKQLSKREKNVLLSSSFNYFPPENIHPSIKKDLVSIRTKFGGIFHNYYSPDFWIMDYNFKNPTANIFFSEVVAAQYEMASELGGFKGRLPSIICRRGIINELNRKFIDEHKDLLLFGYTNNSKQLLRDFLRLPGNGASTKKICERFDLDPVGISMNEVSIYIHVVPIKNKIALRSDVEDKLHLT